MFLESFSDSDIRKEYTVDTMMAPVHEGDKAGTINYYYKDRLIGSVDLMAAETVEVMDYSDSLRKVLGVITFKNADICYIMM